MNKISLSMLLMSHLSDVQSGLCDSVPIRINFIKFLIMKYDNVINENPLGRYFEVDPDAEYEEFQQKHCSKVNGKNYVESDDVDRSVVEIFEKAIKEGRLSTGPTDANYAGHHMFMGYHNGKATFKHIHTRKYID